MPITAMRAGGPLSSVGPDHRLGGLQHRHPHRCRPANISDLEHPEQVGGGDPGQLAPPQRAGCRDRLHRIGVPAGRRDERAGRVVRLDVEQFGPVRASA